MKKSIIGVAVAAVIGASIASFYIGRAMPSRDNNPASQSGQQSPPDNNSATTTTDLKDPSKRLGADVYNMLQNGMSESEVVAKFGSIQSAMPESRSEDAKARPPASEAADIVCKDGYVYVEFASDYSHAATVGPENYVSFFMLLAPSGKPGARP